MVQAGIYVVMRSEQDGYSAKGLFDGKRLLVLKGSTVSKAIRFSLLSDVFAAKRLGLDAFGRLKKDRSFDSPSEASEFISGIPSDGWEEWTTPEGKKLKDCKDDFSSENVVDRASIDAPVSETSKPAMDYSTKVERAKQLRDTINAFLNELARQDNRLEILPKHVNTGIRYCGASIATVFFRTDSIRINAQGKSMLQMIYAELQGANIVCRLEYDDARHTLNRTFIGVDAQDAQAALKVIISMLQDGEPSKSPSNTAPRPEKAKAEPVVIQPEEPVAAQLQEPEFELIHREVAPKEIITEDVLPEAEQEAAVEKEHETQEEQEPTVIVSPVEVHSVLTGKTVKMLLCADLRLGAVSTERLDLAQSRKWQAARNERYADLIERAIQNNAAYIAFFGRIFGQERVSESVIDTLFKAIREEASTTVLAFLTANEHKRISYRNDIPDNLHLINVQGQDSYLDDHVALRIKSNGIELQLGDNDAIIVSRDDEGRYLLNGMPGECVIPSFEPIGFEDAQDSRFGFGIMEWTEDQLGQYQIRKTNKYAYKAIELKILPEDDEKEIVWKINNAIRGIDYDTFLRITITGRSAFGLTISSDALKKQLQSRIFFVEVYDNTVMDIDEEAFETDISLRSEFVRLALQDDSLSESERNRLISCGWNALNGREVSAE